MGKQAGKPDKGTVDLGRPKKIGHGDPRPAGETRSRVHTGFPDIKNENELPQVKVPC